jgi:hypothetical protein
MLRTAFGNRIADHLFIQHQGCHSRAGGNPGLFSTIRSTRYPWIPACAGMTEDMFNCWTTFDPEKLLKKASMQYPCAFSSKNGSKPL